METLQARREWQEIFKVMRTRGLQPTLLYPASLSIKMESQIRSFPGKRNLKEHISSKPALQVHAKGSALRTVKKNSEREMNTDTKNRNE